MKIHKIEIHNIASITDASIDFDSEPLASSEVFLITGPTGSGKSTLLDAVCLALFDTTPRLASRKYGVKENLRELAFADPRQLLRRNTGEGFVRLEFTGNDATRYLAAWSVQRARKKPSGKIQPSARILTRLDDSATWVKKNEIDRIIAEATGLDFARFCRTAMLAQGEFTRFLFSDDKEKAAVLEKLIHSDIYSRVGMAVFNRAKEHREKWQEAVARVEAVVALAPEQWEALCAEQKEISQRQQRLNDLEAQIRIHNEHIALIKSLKARADMQRPEMERAADKAESEAIASKRGLVERWTRSTEARRDLEAIDRCTQTIENGRFTLGQCKGEHELLKADLEQREAEYEELMKRYHAVAKEIELSADQKALMQDGPAIAAALEDADNEAKRITETEITLHRTEVRINTELRPAATKTREGVESVDKELKEIENQRETTARIVDAIDPAGLRSRRDKEMESRGRLLTARSAVAEFTVAKELETKALKEQTEARTELKQTLLKVGDLQAKMEEARSDLDRARQSYELSVNTINKFAREMRRSLTPGCICPVCRQKTEGLLPPEAELDKLAAEARRHRDKAQSDYDESLRKLEGARARADELKQRAENSADTERLTERSRELQLSADRAMRQCGLQPDGNVDEAIAAADARIAALAEMIAKAVEQERQLRDTERLIASERNRIKELELKAAREAEALHREESRWKTLSEAVAADRERLVGRLDEIARRLSGDAIWHFAPGDDPLAAAAAIRADLRQYKARVDEYQNMSAELPSLRTHLDTCRIDAKHTDALSTISAIKVEPRGLKPQNAASAAEEWRKLSEKITAAVSKITAAETEATQRRELLQAFFTGNPDFNEELLRQTAAHGSLFIEQTAREVRAADDARLRTRSALAATLIELRHAIADRPEPLRLPDDPDLTTTLPDDEAERLAELTSRTGARIRQLAERAGAIAAELARSREQEARKAALMAEADELKALSDRWARVDEMFGSADGSKMRRIALSYVLGALIHSANRFMATLSDRYTLSVDPGSFVINVEDAWQGYSVRPASTVSGGESFLVSLALALALSDIGDRQSVDILFIDEGFGTLSGEPLQSAIATLQRLHTAGGRRVGIISHVEELRTRIPVHIQVTPAGGNTRGGSSVEVTRI